MTVIGKAGKGLEELSGQVGMSHRYVIQVDKSAFDLGTWSRAGGLAVSWQRHSYRTGGATTERVLPGHATYTNITLSRAAGRDSATVQRWLAEVTRKRQALSGAVYLIDFLGLPVVTWELREFYPTGWRLSDFDSNSSRPVLETLEIVHGGFLADEVRP